jgi:hypothetical protein
MKVSESAAASKLDDADKEQRKYFRKIFNRKDASPYEFDLVLNMDFVEEPQKAADIAATALRVKFKITMP